MKPRHYFVLLRKGQDRTITEAIILDFPQINLVADNDNKLAQRSDGEAATLIINKINARIAALQLNNRDIPDPSSYEAVYSKFKLGDNDILIGVPIHITPKKGFLAKWLPTVGAFCAVASAVAGAIVSTVGLKLAMKGSAGTTTYSIIQSTVNSGLGVVIYFYAKSGTGLENLGRKLGNLCGRKTIVPELDLDNIPAPEIRHCKTTTKIIITRLLCTGIAISNVVSNAVFLKQQLSALADQAKDDPDALIPLQLLLASIWTMISTGSVSNLSFIGAMVAQLEQDLSKYYRSQIPYEIVDGAELKSVEINSASTTGTPDDKDMPSVRTATAMPVSATVKRSIGL